MGLITGVQRNPAICVALGQFAHEDLDPLV